MGSSTMEICGRLYVLLMAAAAMTASVFTVFSCHFFSYRTIDGEPWEGFDPPFDALPTASVGLFSYSESTVIYSSTEIEKVLFGDECIKYDDWQEAGHSIYFTVAQWCAMVAPCVAFLGWLHIFFDMLCCRLCGGFIMISLSFFFAGALQGCTFLVFSDSQFCFEPESVNKCSFKLGAWYSLGAAVAYLVLALISPCLPISQNEERRGCFVVKTKAPPSTPVEEEPPKEDPQDPEFQVDDEQTDDTNNLEGGTAGEEEKEEEGTGFCGFDLDNLCGGPKVEEEGVEIPPKDAEEGGETDSAALSEPETPASPEPEAPATEEVVEEKKEGGESSPASP